METSKYLNNKDIKIEELAKKALYNHEIFSELLNGILSKNDIVRSNSFKTLLFISEETPESLYPHWLQFEKMIKSSNNYHKYIAIYIIANLTVIDREGKFENISDDYFDIIDSEKTMTASHAALNSGKIAIYKPELKDKITDILLNIDKNHKGKQKELVKSYAIEALDKYFEESDNKERILKFVKAQLESKSPKTRENAEKFLKKHVNNK